jgi:hypothetical protein
MKVHEALRVVFWSSRDQFGESGTYADVDFAGIAGTAIGVGLAIMTFKSDLVRMLCTVVALGFIGRALGFILHGGAVGKAMAASHQYILDHLALISVPILIFCVAFAALTGRWAMQGVSLVLAGVAIFAVGRGQRGLLLALRATICVLLAFLAVAVFVYSASVPFLIAALLCAFFAIMIFREFRRSGPGAGRNRESAAPTSP